MAKQPASSKTPAWPNRRRDLRTLACLWLLALAAWANSFRAGFVYDNAPIILDDPRVHAVTAENAGLIWSQGYWFHSVHQGLYRPFTTLSYLANYAILGNGTQPFGYHAVNLLLHAANIALVYALGLLILEEWTLAAALAALWGVHPALTESVTNIIGRAEMLAAFGTLAGLLCHIYARRSTAHCTTWLTGLALAAAIAIFSKESGVALIAVLLLYDLTRLDRPLRELWASYAAVTLPFAIFFLQRARVLAVIPNDPIQPFDNPLVTAGFWTARLGAIHVIGKYLALLAFPLRLSADYSFDQIPLTAAPAIAALIVCLAVFAVALACWRRCPPAFFFVLFFFVTLAPVSNVFLHIGTIMAERFLYLPSIGFLACVVLALAYLARRIPTVKPLPIAAALCLLLAGRTIARNADWQNGLTLWSSAVETSPASFRAHLSLSSELLRAGQLDRSIAEGERAIVILGRLPAAHQLTYAYVNLGSAYRLRAARQSSAPDLDRALTVLLQGREVDRATTVWYTLYLEIGQTYLRLSRPREALEALDYGIAVHPVPEFLEHISAARRALNDSDGAAVALLQGVLMFPEERGFPSELVALYQRTQPGSCAIQPTAAGANLNLGCPLVHQHLCTAAHDAAALYVRRGDTTAADTTRRIAVESMGCAADSVR